MEGLGKEIVMKGEGSSTLPRETLFEFVKKHENNVKKTKLTKFIVKLVRKYLYKPENFSWTDVFIDDKCVIPKPLNQANTGLCIVYSLAGLFTFQRRLLKSGDKDVNDFSPCILYMIHVFKHMPKNDRTIIQYVQKLMDLHIPDNKETKRLNLTIKKPIKGSRSKKVPFKQDLITIRRFTIKWLYSIDIEAEDMLEQTQEAILKYGGVILGLQAYKTDARGNPLTNPDGTKIIMTLNDKKKSKKKEKKKEKKTKFESIGHAVFCYSCKYENEEVVFRYLNSYGDKDGYGGHRTLKGLQDLTEIYALQLDFNKQGF